MPLSRYLRPLLLAVTAALILVLFTVAYEAARAVMGECDGKFGCTGGIRFSLFFSAIASAISGCALVVVSVMCANTLAQVPLRTVVFIGAAAGLGLAILLRTVGHWPFELPVSAALWASLTAAIGFALVLVASGGLRSKLRG